MDNVVADTTFRYQQVRIMLFLRNLFLRSPLHLLEEIIMIDDKSERDFLREPLNEYVRRFPVNLLCFLLIFQFSDSNSYCSPERA